MSVPAQVAGSALCVPGAASVATWPLLIMLAQLPVPPARARARDPSSLTRYSSDFVKLFLNQHQSSFTGLKLSFILLIENFPTMKSWWCKGCVWWWGPSDRTPVQGLAQCGPGQEPHLLSIDSPPAQPSPVICGSEQQSFYWTTWKLWLKHLSIEIWWIGNKIQRAIHFAIFSG